jgi:hypothetical protein
MKVQVTIDVPEGWELTDLEPVAIDYDQWFINPDGIVERWDIRSTPSCGKYFRVRRAWQWPAWLEKAAAIAMDESGDWYAYEAVPKRYEGAWDSLDGDLLGMCEFSGILPDFTPPPCDDWTKSLRLNPNRKESTQ